MKISHGKKATNISKAELSEQGMRRIAKKFETAKVPKQALKMNPGISFGTCDAQGAGLACRRGHAPEGRPHFSLQDSRIGILNSALDWVASIVRLNQVSNVFILGDVVSAGTSQVLSSYL